MRSKILKIVSNGIRGFRRNTKIIDERGVNKSYVARDAYEHLAGIMDTNVSMAWLPQLVDQKGAKMLTRTIE